MNKLPAISFILFAVIAGFFLWQTNQNKQTSPQDQSPGVDATWKTFTDTQQGFTFKFPEKLPTTYISAQSWPPVIKIKSGTSACTNEERTINGWPYCVKTTSEGAAGSIYTTYNYSSAEPDSGQTIEATFTLRSVQCGNYDEPEKTACEQERRSFDLDGLVYKIFSTIQQPAATT